MADLKKQYLEKTNAAMNEKFKYANPMNIPQLKKVVVSMGLAEAAKDKNAFLDAQNELKMLTGQKPLLTKAKKSIAGFKLRQGQAIGAKVTLRGKRMYDFIYRFCNIITPRIRDFRGFTKKGDGQGNCSIGIDDQQIFPEINLDLVKRTQGMNITFVTSALNDAECLELLTLMGVPFKQGK